MSVTADYQHIEHQQLEKKLYPPVYDAVRSQPEWADLRKEILRKAIQLTGSGVTFDFREMLFNADNASRAAQLLWKLIKPFGVKLLIGPGFGAAPLLFSIAHAAREDGDELDVLMVRDQRKGHNKKKWVEGRLHPAGTKAVIVDDFIDAGSVVSLVEQALEADGHDLDIVAMIVFFDMWQPLGSRQISLRKFPVIPLFKRHDIGLSRDAFDAKPPKMRGAYPDFIEKPLWWRFELNETKSYRYKSTPIVTEEAIFCADDSSRVSRYNAKTGALEWEYQSLERPLKGIVQLLQHVDESLIFGCYDGTVTRLRASTGEVQWRWRQGSSIHATPAIDLVKKRLFINTEQWNGGSPCGHLQALDLDTGRQLWAASHRYWPPGSPVYDGTHQCVVATCNDETVVCVDASTGVIRWTERTKGLVRGRPAIDGDNLFLATETGMLHCLDIRDGATVWERRYGKPGAHHFVETGEGCVYILDGKWNFVALDIKTGAIRWLNRLRSPGVWAPVRMGKYLIVVSQDGQIAVMDSEKELKVWEGHAGGRVFQPPAVSVGLLALATNDAGLKVYSVNEFYQQ
ncbi:outer membrane protein assembly factor BamB/orotate phosphoribosyltransferase [Herbaspirillum sp. Sphag1AN]|uniref:outer membrane protein assembly factor BamB family protein n=1 Tax=unclassified Herbaspirillum TaxID=2624150 RepID=UPI001619774E|nr:MULTISPECIES: PQQ-binding-like beta-propeller repeat protein [unclassified Herbaspirillum]MBB3211650.1 outer membrane protein assembly factor BamB/orotate phosphoribosyltransferase [Herbaspirillum sp. Sphag1AN]MBB3245082.1 outer membrane protein assembly factor BamB/orotate phosphoribosyltransferase [Herbaspirillum sp. Sphag64]